MHWALCLTAAAGRALCYRALAGCSRAAPLRVSCFRSPVCGTTHRAPPLRRTIGVLHAACAIASCRACAFGYGSVPC
eukprot:8720699-Alexandrium_andersonii.AAC.1